MNGKLSYTVTGPDAERRAESPEVGLSIAITLAAKATTDVTYYVRDKLGDITGRAERTGNHVEIVRL